MERRSVVDGPSTDQSAQGVRSEPAPGASACLKISVLVAGLSVMAAEMSAPRLLAPSFGTTQLIWTNIIGIVLAALTLGAYAGGRLADRWPREAVYARMIMVAGALLALIPLISAPLLSHGARSLAGQQVGTFLGSLVAICLLFAPPVFLLGMINPWAIRIAGAGRRDLGRVAGGLAGLSALGSILGTFLASLVTLPWLGTRTTLLAVGGLLVVVGAWRAIAPGRRRALGLACGAALPLAGGQPVKSDLGQIYEAESLYQYIQVRKDRQGWMRLYLNEGLGAQSVASPSGGLTYGVWDYLSVVSAMTTASSTHLRVLILGLAAGTVAQQLDAAYGADRTLTLDGVEIDAAVVDVGRRFFGLGDIPNLRIQIGDARQVLESLSGPYDAILVDAYRGSYIPFQLVTREFFSAAQARLAPTGVLVLNVATLPGAAELLDSIGATLRSELPHAYRFELANPGLPFRNFVYMGSDRPLTPPEVRDLPAPLASVDLRPMRRTWTAVNETPDSLVFTDDRAPVKWMTDSAILGLVRPAFTARGPARRPVARPVQHPDRLEP